MTPEELSLIYDQRDQDKANDPLHVHFRLSGENKSRDGFLYERNGTIIIYDKTEDGICYYPATRIDVILVPVN